MMIDINGVYVRTFTTDEARAKIISHTLCRVRDFGHVPEFDALDVDQQVLATLLELGGSPVYCATDAVGNVAVCALSALATDPHCVGLGLHVGYFIAASDNPKVASTLMRLAVNYAKSVNANWLGTSKRVGVNTYSYRYHYL